MFAYQLRLAFKSLRRNPVLSTLLVAAIGLGIAVSTASVTIYHIYSSNPIPHKSDVLFHVEIDNWHPDHPFDSDHPERAPFQVTYRDAMAIMQSQIPTYQSAAFRTELMVFPDGDEQRPFREIVRMCFADFFMMFDVPFQYGDGWDDAADQSPEPVIVIDSKTNQRLFGGSNSVGRSLKIVDRYFTIVGVLAPWRPTPKHYDPTINAFGEPEAIYMPFNFTPVFEITNSGNTWGWMSETNPQLNRDIIHHTVVGCSGGGKHRYIPWKCLQDPYNATVIRSEIMPPVGYTMRFIHDKQSQSLSNRDQNIFTKRIVG